MNPKDLLNERESVLSAILASTYAHPLALAAFVDAKLTALAARAAAGARSSRKHSEKLRAAIRLACGGLSPHNPYTANAIMIRIDRRPTYFGVKAAPSEETVRAELLQMKKESKPVPVSLPQSQSGFYHSTIKST